LIYKSQTACYARERRAAIHKLGDNFDCVCNPEIMAAFIYALNDADERVRAKAADEIGDQIRESGGCCCSEEVTAALTHALGDCHWAVRFQAEQALELCGYCIVDGECNSCGGCNGAAPAPALGPSPSEAPIVTPPAPAPATEDDAPKALPPRELDQSEASQVRGFKSRLFGFLD
jgi:hypothetical protein